jgi:hypothetical protein
MVNPPVGTTECDAAASSGGPCSPETILCNCGYCIWCHADCCLFPLLLFVGSAVLHHWNSYGCDCKYNTVKIHFEGVFVLIPQSYKSGDLKNAEEKSKISHACSAVGLFAAIAGCSIILFIVVAAWHWYYHSDIHICDIITNFLSFVMISPCPWILIMYNRPDYLLLEIDTYALMSVHNCIL